MIVSWLLYAAWVAALLSLGAWAAERALRLVGRPARLLWLGAMILSVLIPSVTGALRAWGPEASLALPSVGLSELVLPALRSVAESGAAEWTGQRRTDLVLAATWGAATIALLTLLVGAQWRLRRERAGWIRTHVDGVPVLLSRRTGPATVGGLRPRVVLPEWAVALPTAQREMILRHELEHVRARDGLIALAGFALTALAPWNAPLWWMLARLRLAQEMDCDRRLLAAGVPIRGYVNLLMTSGRPALGASLAAPGLSFSPNTLRKRILQMTHIPRRSSLFQATAIGTVAVGLGLLACDTPAPGENTGLTGPAADVVPSNSAVEVGPEEVAVEEAVLVKLLGMLGIRALRSETRRAEETAVRLKVLPLDSSTERPVVPALAATVDAKARTERLERVRLAVGPLLEDQPSLIVLNGEIWEGSREELKRRLSESETVETHLLAGPEAVARFGARAADGATVIDTEGN